MRVPTWTGTRLGWRAPALRLKYYFLDITHVYDEVFTDWTALCHVLEAYLTSYSSSNLLSRRVLLFIPTISLLSPISPIYNVRLEQTIMSRSGFSKDSYPPLLIPAKGASVGLSLHPEGVL